MKRIIFLLIGLVLLTNFVYRYRISSIIGGEYDEELLLESETQQLYNQLLKSHLIKDQTEFFSGDTSLTLKALIVWRLTSFPVEFRLYQDWGDTVARQVALVYGILSNNGNLGEDFWWGLNGYSLYHKIIVDSLNSVDFVRRTLKKYKPIIDVWLKFLSKQEKQAIKKYFRESKNFILNLNETKIKKYYYDYQNEPDMWMYNYDWQYPKLNAFLLRRLWDGQGLEIDGKKREGSWTVEEMRKFMKEVEQTFPWLKG